jgi:hypothetical protein
LPAKPVGFRAASQRQAPAVQHRPKIALRLEFAHDVAGFDHVCFRVEGDVADALRVLVSQPFSRRQAVIPEMSFSRTVRRPAHFWYTLDTSLRQKLIAGCSESLWQPRKIGFLTFDWNRRDSALLQGITSASGEHLWVIFMLRVNSVLRPVA